MTVVLFMPQCSLVVGTKASALKMQGSMFRQYTGVRPLWYTESKPEENSGRVEEYRCTSLLGA